MTQLDVKRETWTHKLDFLLSCIGYSVGLGNIWRFPYLCYRNGGGAFIIPYAIMLFLAGLPIYFFELALGQFASEGPITVWKVNPLFYGIGWGMVTISALVCVYYNVIIMYAIYYMFVSFVNLDSDVPWIDCDNPWNTPKCRQEPYPKFDQMANETAKIYEQNRWIASFKYLCSYAPPFLNLFFQLVKILFFWALLLIRERYICDAKTAMTKKRYIYYPFGGTYQRGIIEQSQTRVKKTKSSTKVNFDFRFVLRLQDADGIGDIGSINLKNILCLLFTWILIFFCLMKGIKSSGRIVYFTATFPYVLLIVLLVRGLTLDGYKEGVDFYIIPDWEKLNDAKVWSDAATQIFYSLGPAFGSLICMSSFNKFHNNCWRDSVIVAFTNCCTSIFAGFVIFSLLGFMAHNTNQAVEDVADSGPGLAFVAYPEGIARLPVNSLWAFLFFFMILTIGLDSQFVMMETVISGLSDIWPALLRKNKALFTFVCCMVGFALGIPMTTRGGIYVLTLFDWYSGSYNLMIICFFELAAVCWLYGIRRFKADIELMFGGPPFLLWFYYLPAWVFVTPASIIFIVVMTFVNYTGAYYGDYVFEPWAEAVGWILAMLPVSMILVGAILEIVRNKGNIHKSITPRLDWGPRLKVNRKGRYEDNFGYESDEESPAPSYHEKNGSAYMTKDSANAYRL